MENCNYKIGVLILIAAVLSLNKAEIEESCRKFSRYMTWMKERIEIKEKFDYIPEKYGCVTPHSVFGVRFDNQCIDAEVKLAKIVTRVAQYYKDDVHVSLKKFESTADKCKDVLDPPDQCIQDLLSNTKVHQKYRSIDGRGNNAKNPHWGASATPFSRFSPKNYEDGIYSIKKSVVDGSDLPNARLLVQEVLTKAFRSTPPPETLNVVALLIILFATHDLHYQVPMQPKGGDKEILCCSKNRYPLPLETLSNNACLSIEVSKADILYKNGKIGCLNMVRTQIGELPGQIEPGEIMDHATGYIDLSLIYGNHESQTKELRLYKEGKLRMGKNNLLPVNANDEYIKAMDRFVAVPVASIWPSLFARNHNHLTERLAALNPHWND